MLAFECDYMEGAHPQVLRHLTETNLEPLSGYSTDRYCESAVNHIRAACGDPTADVFFLVGGTQTNQVVISSLLRSWEGVVAAQTGHVAVHEAGAIELSGHKILTLPHHHGKLSPKEVEEYLAAFWKDENRDHMVFPGMVYISHPTELGTLYTRDELEALSSLCRRYSIPLYLDGARLAYGLMSDEADVTLSDITRLCDVFYIGGTKAGALCGEAVVFPGGGAPSHFVTTVKQHGALLAKGRLLGVQFDALFADGLYFEIGRHAIQMASLLRQVLEKHRIPFYAASPTNQQFVVMEDRLLAQLTGKVAYSFWEKADEDHTVLRLATSWATTPEDIRALDALLSSLM